MKKQLGKKILGAALASAMVVSLASAPSALAAGVTLNSDDGTGVVYAPADIIDVVVPTKYDIAMNPLQIKIDSTSGLQGSTQILSGTYSIENRSTIPVSINAAFTVAGGTKSKLGTAEQVAAEDAKEDQTKAVPMFSLDMITTAAGTAQKLTTEPTATPDGTAKMRKADEATGAKIAKESAKALKFTTTTNASTGATSVNTKPAVTFMLAKGPYTPEYDKESNSVAYKAKSGGAYDTVSFRFTGTTTTNVANWTLDSGKQPTIKAVYTLTESTDSVYNKTGFSNVWKNVPLVKTDAQLTTAGTGNITIDLATLGETTVKATKKGTDYIYSGVSFTLQSLQPDNKKATLKLGDGDTALGTATGATPATETEKEDLTVKSITLDAAKLVETELTKGAPLEKGYYLLTFGKTSQILYYGN